MVRLGVIAESLVWGIDYASSVSLLQVHLSDMVEIHVLLVAYFNVLDPFALHTCSSWGHHELTLLILLWITVFLAWTSSYSAWAAEYRTVLPLPPLGLVFDSEVIVLRVQVLNRDVAAMSDQKVIWVDEPFWVQSHEATERFELAGIPVPAFFDNFWVAVLNAAAPLMRNLTDLEK